MASTVLQDVRHIRAGPRSPPRKSCAYSDASRFRTGPYPRPWIGSLYCEVMADRSAPSPRLPCRGGFLRHMRRDPPDDRSGREGCSGVVAPDSGGCIAPVARMAFGSSRVPYPVRDGPVPAGRLCARQSLGALDRCAPHGRFSRPQIEESIFTCRRVRTLAVLASSWPDGRDDRGKTEPVRHRRQ